MATVLFHGPIKLHCGSRECVGQAMCPHRTAATWPGRTQNGDSHWCAATCEPRGQKEGTQEISVYQVLCLWVLSSSRHFAFFISLHFHNKPMRIIGSMILQVRKLRLTEVTCLQKYIFCVKEEKRRGKKKSKISLFTNLSTVH